MCSLHLPEFIKHLKLPKIQKVSDSTPSLALSQEKSVDDVEDQNCQEDILQSRIGSTSPAHIVEGISTSAAESDKRTTAHMTLHMKHTKVYIPWGRPDRRIVR